jgi:hypothetical protein
MTLFIGILPPESVARVLDLVIVEGGQALFAVALGMLGGCWGCF